jgi:hypothetical protein
MKKVGLTSLLAAVTVCVAADASPRFGANDIRTLFFIGKSDDHNEVHYGIHLAPDCTPIGDEPIFAYWRQVEQGPNVFDDLNLLDRTVYGVRRQTVLKRTPEETRIQMTLRATSDRSVTIIVNRRDGKCVSDAVAAIQGRPAHLERIFVHVAGLFKVDWIEIRGTSGGNVVVERVKP